MNEISHSFISGSSVPLPVRHSPHPLAAGSVLCVWAQSSPSAEKLNLARYHCRPKCTSWLEYIFQLSSVRRQFTLFPAFSTNSFFFAVWLANRCSALGICQRSHWRVAVSCPAGCASTVLVRPQEHAFHFQFPCTFEFEIHLRNIAQFSCSDVHRNDNKENVDATSRCFLRHSLHLCSKLVGKGEGLKKIIEEKKISF